MERKIGEIFEFNGEWYQCLKSPDGGCKHCDMNFEGKCPIPIKECVASSRSDLSYVIFKKLEKVGGPCKSLGLAIPNGVIVELYKTYTKAILPLNVGCILNDYLIAIKVKQNKDMKTIKVSKDDLNFLVNKIRYGILPKCSDYDEIVAEIIKLFSTEDINLSNSKNIGKNLKPFDLEAAKAGKSVCTRDGRKARIICFDRVGDFPIVALTDDREYKEEGVNLYDINGKGSNECFDLMMLPEKKEGWVNIYNTNRAYYYVSGKVFKTKDEAMQEVKYEIEIGQIKEEEYTSTIKISWEE